MIYLSYKVNILISEKRSWQCQCPRQTRWGWRVRRRKGVCNLYYSSSIQNSVHENEFAKAKVCGLL